MTIIIIKIKRNHYAWVCGRVVLLVTCLVISRDFQFFFSAFSSHQYSRILFSIFISSVSLSLFFFFSFFNVTHYYYYRRMTTNNNSDSPPPLLSLVPSFNHHRFVSFGSAVPPIIAVTTTTTAAAAAAAVSSSFQSFSMLRPYEQYFSYY